MSSLQNDVLDWVAQRRLSEENGERALRIAGLMPSRREWRDFFDRICLWGGVFFLAAAIIFFFAYNWSEMDRFAKLGLAELAILGATAAAWRLGIERVAGKAAVLLAALLIGALLALIGQIYQTGADTYELFAAWALAVLPLAAVTRFGPLWLLWIALVNMALMLYGQTFGGLFGFLFGESGPPWTLFFFDMLALCMWEFAARSGVAWLKPRWSPRIVAWAAGCIVTGMALWAVSEFNGKAWGGTIPVYLLWLASLYAYYRYAMRDLFMLAGGALSAIIVVTALLSRLLLRNDPGAAFLFIGMLVIGMSAAAAIWLRSLAKEAA